MAGHREQLGAAIVGLAQIQERLPTVIDDVRDAGERLGIVDRGRLAVQTKAGGERRLEARLAFFAFYGFEQRGFFAADVRAVAQMVVQLKIETQAHDVFAHEPGAARLFTGGFHALVGFEYLAVHIVVAGLHTHGVSRDGHAFDQQVRVVTQDVPVFARAGLAFVGITNDIFVAGKTARHEAPLQAGGEARAAAPAQGRQLHVGDDGFG